MKVIELLEKVRHRVENPNCVRCGKEFYLPKPPEEIFHKWGIMTWTTFVKQYAKHHGWHELKNLNGNIVCADCLRPTDTENTIMLDDYPKWIKEYEVWRKS